MSPQFLGRVWLIAAALSIGAPFLSPSAAAHAVIVESTPAPDAVIHDGTLAITLRYNSRIDHERSRLTLISADGKVHSLAIDPNSAPDIIAAEAEGLVTGTYRLRWQVLAVDGHLTRGDIPFTVKAP